MRSFLAAVVLAAASPVVGACDCTHGFIGTTELSETQSVFVFRAVAARVQTPTDPAERPYLATLEIEVVETLHGASPPTLLEYSFFWCCGSTFEVGLYYVTFMDHKSFGARRLHFGNTAPLDIYDDRRLQEIRAGLKEMEAGSTLAEAVPWLDGIGVSNTPLPPPPCPRRAP